MKTVGRWLAERTVEGVKPHEIGVFVRSAAELERARAAVEAAGLAFKVLAENVETASGHVSISTMHLGKGLELRSVVVMACDDEVIPCRSGPRRSRTTRTWRRFTTPSGTCSMLPVPVLEITCW